MLHVAGEPWLAVCPKRAQPPRRCEHSLRDEPRDRCPAIEPSGQWWHREASVLGEKTDETRHIEAFRAKAGAPTPGMSFEEVLEIAEYVNGVFGKTAYAAALRTFWEDAATLAPALPPAERAAFLAILWGGHAPLTDLYLRLAQALGRIGHPEEVFAPLDALTIPLATAGLLLLCQVIGQGRSLWWSDTPWLGVALALSIPLLTAAFLIETGRKNPLVHFEWIGSWGILRFAAVALVLRLALAEQTYGAVGLLTLGGLNNDQLRILFAMVAIAMIAGIIVAALTLSERRLPWQVLVAALIIAGGAWIDSDATNLTRPAQLMLSQAMIGFGTTLFVGPALLYGFLRMIRRGGDHLVSFVVTFSITQNVGGLMGSALLGSMQTIWARNAANILSADMLGSDPQTAARLSSGAATLAGALVDPAQRAGQGAGLLGQAMAREAAIIAFTDTFRLVAMLALAIALFIFANILLSRRYKVEPA